MQCKKTQGDHHPITGGVVHFCDTFHDGRRTEVRHYDTETDHPKIGTSRSVQSWPSLDSLISGCRHAITISDERIIGKSRLTDFLQQLGASVPICQRCHSLESSSPDALSLVRVRQPVVASFPQPRPVAAVVSRVMLPVSELRVEPNGSRVEKESAASQNLIDAV